MSRIRIGVSGWEYDGWTDDFYPRELARRRRLEYLGRVFDTVEVNGTFYSLKSPATFERWYTSVPGNFRFALRGSRFITHVRRLRDPTVPLANFLANGLLRLEDKLGPILWQTPPNMDWDADTFEAFCARLPPDTRQASALARRHDERVRDRASYHVDTNRNLRHAFEIRDPRMMCPEMLRILRRHGHALVVSDTAQKYPYAEDITAGFVYVRLHGAGQMYVGHYDDRARARWRDRIERWASAREPADAERVSDFAPPRRKGRDVYVYFDNDAHGHAPFDALHLARDLGVAKDPCTLADAEGHRLPPPPRIISTCGHPDSADAHAP